MSKGDRPMSNQRTVSWIRTESDGRTVEASSSLAATPTGTPTPMGTNVRGGSVLESQQHPPLAVLLATGSRGGFERSRIGGDNDNDNNNDGGVGVGVEDSAAYTNTFAKQNEVIGIGVGVVRSPPHVLGLLQQKLPLGFEPLRPKDGFHVLSPGAAHTVGNLILWSTSTSRSTKLTAHRDVDARATVLPFVSEPIVIAIAIFPLVLDNPFEDIAVCGAASRCSTVRTVWLRNEICSCTVLVSVRRSASSIYRYEYKHKYKYFRTLVVRVRVLVCFATRPDNIVRDGCSYTMDVRSTRTR
eukprot:CAMPEP_0168310216 /NCGR_PEP_ID=MMETSP0142_2-20121227/66706_1 /TAXON_ID=44445 /ORGANISM="Pseudo-nitzschia australis, Strain 10249 10 AB" /LENGTH=298 /DNA_ID=CAMNT_0008263015 /DNA_START=78 /DNA_END=970 /DNA_ORIENTATION=+